MSLIHGLAISSSHHSNAGSREISGFHASDCECFVTQILEEFYLYVTKSPWFATRSGGGKLRLPYLPDLTLLIFLSNSNLTF